MKSARFLLAAAFAAQPAIAAPSAADDERDIRRVEQALCAAFQAGAGETIARLEDATYTLTNSHGDVTARADDVADAKKGDVRYSEFRNHDSKVRLYGDAAIVTGITSLKGVAAGKSFESDFAFTDTYVRRADGWKIAASHASRLDKKPKP
jgi:ketosteroid isomerase-like protein